MKLDELKNYHNYWLQFNENYKHYEDKRKVIKKKFK